MAGRKRKSKKRDEKEVNNESVSNQENIIENITNVDEPGVDPPDDDDIVYDIKKAGKFLLMAFQESEEFKKITDDESRAVQYDKWRKKSKEEG